MKLPDLDSPRAAVVLADGAYPAGDLAAGILAAAPWVVCCDGAADKFVARGGEPAAIVGDCDSLSPALCARYADRLHPVAEQETNDLTKAVDFCIAQGRREIVILGATGLREDHTLGNISLLCHYRSRGCNVMMITDYGIFTPIDGQAAFDSFPGQQVSAFALDPRTRLEFRGLRYRLAGDRAHSWWQGTLNEAPGDNFTVVSDGPAIIFRTFR